FQAEDGIRDFHVTGVQTCALPIYGEYVLFCQEKIKEQEIWTGRRVGPEAAPQVLGCDDAFPISDIDDILPGLIEGKDRIYASLEIGRASCRERVKSPVVGESVNKR